MHHSLHFLSIELFKIHFPIYLPIVQSSALSVGLTHLVFCQIFYLLYFLQLCIYIVSFHLCAIILLSKFFVRYMFSRTYPLYSSPNPQFHSLVSPCNLCCWTPCFSSILVNVPCLYTGKYLPFSVNSVWPC